MRFPYSSESRAVVKLVRNAIRRLVAARAEEPGTPMFEYAYVTAETSNGEKARPARPWNWCPPGYPQEMAPRHRQHSINGLGIEPVEEAERIERVLSPGEAAALVAKGGRKADRAAAELGITVRAFQGRIENAHKKLVAEAQRVLEKTR